MMAMAMVTAMAVTLVMPSARVRSSGLHNSGINKPTPPHPGNSNPLSHGGRTTRTYPTTTHWQRNFLDSIERRDYSYAYKPMEFGATLEWLSHFSGRTWGAPDLVLLPTLAALCSLSPP